MSAVLGWQLGAGVDAEALLGSARYDLVPGARAWVGGAAPVRGPVSLGGTLELQGAWLRARTDLYTYDTVFVRASPTLDLGVGSEGARFVLAAGPALSVRDIDLSSDTVEARSLLVEPGARARLGVDVGFGGHGLFRWHVGLTSRDAAPDYDTGLGLGVRW